ncbi:hypoxanthine phosphoribosyltransferase [Sinanaerobacter sp. ZZT-01]|uniref:hypoxanthine phosphoribosyltransferase n=1 Tax=Sinanaerobacter sp. ZZT-01 TaxID=3111540 RepID=UPI002D791C9B|nr:hypoxanthine phosphoribosyltransferase [Sinanaerobacter sp. ZZT-01]WRR92186.1 hypoxanthine phosphoribosyltransferase [Sinanaerobacter sp. ZZT-01]
MKEKQYVFGEILISEEQLKKRTKEIGKQITEEYKGESILAVCILKGAVLFMTDLIREIDLDVQIDFMSVSSYGASTKSSGVVRILKDLDTAIEGKNVLIIEDIVDSGLTLKYLKDYLMGRNPKSLKICTLLDKPARRSADILADYTGFEVEDQFIVGYGLDYNQMYRNIPYITCLVEK